MRGDGATDCRSPESRCLSIVLVDALWSTAVPPRLAPAAQWRPQPAQVLDRRGEARILDSSANSALQTRLLHPQMARRTHKAARRSVRARAGRVGPAEAVRERRERLTGHRLAA